MGHFLNVVPGPFSSVSYKPFKVLKVDKTLVDYYTKLSDFHAQFRCIGTNYNQVVKELRIHFSEKKAMALLYKLEKCTIDLVKLSREIVELSREMEAKWQQQPQQYDSR